MRIVHVETVLSSGGFATSEAWSAIRSSLLVAIKAVDWPEGSGSFTIFPESGKKRRAGSGVTSIKQGLMTRLETSGWKLEERIPITARRQPGKIDAVLFTDAGPVALEWETGNISSSHRALNKMLLGLLQGKLAAGVLVVPSRALYRFLTDRVGNWDELVPYLDLWKSVPVKQGVLEIVVIEHDSTSTDVPRMRKGTDGRAVE
ncbi:MAG TPA: hypothetical protein PLS53_04685 [Thermoanaerobaculaceae bacterium]|nr:hypothetical protein [Thermoanaerobaculaceae bacterium]HPS77431.1 hypothetical protein [Thermoanaerobaculaceae bacterium]